MVSCKQVMQLWLWGPALVRLTSQCARLEVRSHRLLHSLWTCLNEPEHLQGQVRGLSGSESVPQQMRQAGSSSDATLLSDCSIRPTVLIRSAGQLAVSGARPGFPRSASTTASSVTSQDS